MGLRKLLESVDRRLLEHEVKLVAAVATRGEHSVVGGKFGVDPHTVAHHIGLRHLHPRMVGPDKHIAARYQCGKSGRCVGEYLFIERQLEREQILVELLAPLPSKHRHRCENLSHRSICRQSPALSAGMDDDFRSRERGVGVGLKPLFHKPGGASTRAHLPARGVCGAEPFLRWQVFEPVEALHEVGRQREQLVCRFGSLCHRDII